MLSISIFSSCSSIPKGVKAGSNFKKEKYLGRWYEIARLENCFERNMNNTTARYSLKENGTIKVVNAGYDTKKKKWKEVEGKAKFVKEESTAMLKVSFFGPFYSGYNVIAIDKAYKYSLVAGQNFGYLWILSREKTIPEDVKAEYLKIAKNYGFAVDDLMWITHDDTFK